MARRLAETTKNSVRLRDISALPYMLPPGAKRGVQHGETVAALSPRPLPEDESHESGKRFICLAKNARNTSPATAPPVPSRRKKWPAHPMGLIAARLFCESCRR
jgi:hypothetical protein